MNIMLVEDNATDVLFLKQALENGPESTTLQVLDSGDKATAHLWDALRRYPADLPDIILLDLNLPGKDGFEVLGEVKSEDRLKTIPVIVVSTSSSSTDVERAYKLHANGYIVKPSDFIEFERIAEALLSFWGREVTYPVRDGVP